MFFDAGFLGTRAAFYMDAVGVFFVLIPILLAIAIRFAMKKKFKSHYQSHIAIYALTLLVVILFEVGVRLSGGFTEFMKESPVNPTFFVIFLIVHIVIALLTIVAWTYQVIVSWKAYKRGQLNEKRAKNHKLIGGLIYTGMVITVLMGGGIYYSLFVM